MIAVYPYATLGHADHGWLDARHHFSFARYWNPARTQFGALRVVNDDLVKAGAGFGLHPHDNMEIITYVRRGAITHRDDLGNHGRTGAGDVQIMSAGTGVRHSEHNHEDIDTRLYQIWITPNRLNVPPRWEMRQFPGGFVPGGAALPVLVSGRAEDTAASALSMHQDAAISGGKLRAGSAVIQPVKYQAYLLAAAGSMAVNGVPIEPGDGAEVTGEPVLTIAALTDAEILIIDVPPGA